MSVSRIYLADLFLCKGFKIIELGEPSGHRLIDSIVVFVGIVYHDAECQFAIVWPEMPGFYGFCVVCPRVFFIEE